MCRILIVLLSGTVLAGCAGRSGYVESDIPVVAEQVATWQRQLPGKECPYGTIETIVRAQASHTTTRVGMKRARYEYQIVCR